jgi:hypothetical protein
MMDDEEIDTKQEIPGTSVQCIRAMSGHAIPLFFFFCTVYNSTVVHQHTWYDDRPLLNCTTRELGETVSISRSDY